MVAILCPPSWTAPHVVPTEPQPRHLSPGAIFLTVLVAGAGRAERGIKDNFARFIWESQASSISSARHRQNRMTAALLAGVSWGIAGLLVSGAAQAQSGPFLYVPDSASSNVSVIDTSTNSVPFSAIPVGPGIAAVVRGDGSFVYVTNDNGTVTPVDTTANTLGTPIPIAPIVLGAAITPNGKTVYVANVTTTGFPGAIGFVTPIDTATNAAGTPINVGYNPRGLAVSPDGTTIYVANLIEPSTGMGAVTPINTATNTAGTPIPVGPGNQAFSLAVTPDGKTIYATDPFSNNLTVINTVTKVATTIPIGATSFGLAVTPNGSTVYVANASANTVTVINTATNTVEGSIPVPGANGVAVSPDGKTVYVTNFSSGTVTPIDTATNTAGTPIPVGMDPEIFPGISSNGNALLATGLTFVARTSGALASTLASGPTGSPGPIFTGGTLQFAGANITSALPISLQAEGGTFDTLANNATLSGSISGPGELSKIGTGTLTLTANNTYSGGTTIAAGMLQLGAGGASGSIVGNVTDNGTLAFNRSDIVTFSGVISGTGSLAQIGPGTTVLTANSTYSGGTTIAAGTLQLGNGGTTGSILGNVTNNGTLAFNRSDTVTFPGVISGTGGVAQIGLGTTILTGDNTFTGSVTISGGTLELGSGGTSGSIVIDVADSGTLSFDHSNVVTFAHVISGPGGVAQIGTGTTILTANNPYTGGTAVSAGTLVIGDPANPSAALSGGGPIAVASGATLGGYGSVTGSVTNNGTVAAGNATPGFGTSPAGTFTIIGNLFNQGTVNLASDPNRWQRAGGSRQLCRCRRYAQSQYRPGKR